MSKQLGLPPAEDFREAVPGDMIRFSTFTPRISLQCCYCMLAAHHVLYSPLAQAVRNYNYTGTAGLVWC